MKKLLFVLPVLALIAGAFFLLPRLLLHVSDNADKRKESVPVGRALPTGTPGAAGASAAATRRFDAFAAVQSAAGFTPLTPSSLPAGYQPWEQFLRAAGPAEVVLSFVKPDNLSILIDQRTHDPNSRAFFRPDFPPGPGGPGVPGGGRGPQARPALIDINGTQGVYAQGLVGFGNRQLADPSRPPLQRNTQPHRVLFTRGDLDIIVEADMTDVPREELIRIAAGLR